jgi:hypothetical protein
MGTVSIFKNGFGIARGLQLGGYVLKNVQVGPRRGRRAPSAARGGAP